jgi:hypothetical protein
MKTWKKHLLTVSVVAASIAAMAMTASSAELVVNGGFDEVLVNWSVDDALGSWIPYEHPGGTVSLSPDVMAYTGPVISQSLNVPGIASQSVNISVDIGSEWGLSEGQSIAIRLEYMDSGGNRQSAIVINPNNILVPSGGMQSFSASYTFSADTDRLVGISIERLEDVWGARVDNISVTSSTLTPGPVPHLARVWPQAVEYGQTVLIKGNEFGSTAGAVRIGGTTNGVSVQSWTANAIEVLIGTACTGGNVEVDALGPRTCEKRNLGITSPHFLLELSPENTVATAGQPVQVSVRTQFREGFATMDGVLLSVPEAVSGSAFSPVPVMADGGSLLTLDTTGLSAGIHTFTVQAAESNSPLRSAQFSVDIREVADITLSADGSTFTEQAPVMPTATITDTLGNDISDTIPKLSWSTGDPSVLEVFEEQTPWGSLYLLPHSTGSSTVRATLPGGSYYEFNVNVAIPAEPRVEVHTCTSTTMSNNPAETNQLYFLASGPMTYYSYGISDLGVISHDGYWNGDNSSHTYDFTLSDNEKPGVYMFTSGGTVGGVSVSDGCLLNVVNDLATGMVKGHISQFGGDMFGHGANGSLEFYDDSGNLVFSRTIWEWTSNYTVPRIPPGTYKLRFVPDSFSSSSPLPQWFPNATTNSEAAVVTVTAGGTQENINFTVSPADSAAGDPPLTDPPSYAPATGALSYSIQTTANSNYDFLKSASLKDGSWYLLNTIWGDGNSAVVEDTNATSSVGFYRVVPQ